MCCTGNVRNKISLMPPLALQVSWRPRAFQLLIAGVFEPAGPVVALRKQNKDRAFAKFLCKPVLSGRCFVGPWQIVGYYCNNQRLEFYTTLPRVNCGSDRDVKIVLCRRISGIIAGIHTGCKAFPRAMTRSINT